MKKEKDLSKVTDIENSDYIRMITKSGESVQINKADFASAINEALPLATISSKGLQSAGFRETVSHGTTGSGYLIIQYNTKAHFVSLLKTGSYQHPSFYLIRIGMNGGAISGNPYSLVIKLISGGATITEAKAFLRNNKTCLELKLANTYNHSASTIIDMTSQIESFSTNMEDLYKETSDTDMIPGSIEN